MRLFLLFTVGTLFFSSCSKFDGCSVNQQFTEEFRSIYVKITVQNGAPLLDSYTTTRVKDSKIVNDDGGFVFENPIIIDDSHLKETNKKGEMFLFEAYKDGNKVISEEYVIKHDCCHIIKVSGKDTINL